MSSSEGTVDNVISFPSRDEPHFTCECGSVWFVASIVVRRDGELVSRAAAATCLECLVAVTLPGLTSG